MPYLTKATTKGGRNGRAMLDDGGLALAMAIPKEIGGAGDGHNPEQLFALGWSACFGQAILVRLLPRNLAIQIFHALLENNASFYGAQMSAMDNATRNAGEMIRKQTLVYNRTRQAQITKELIEIISGAEAV